MILSIIEKVWWFYENIAVPLGVFVGLLLAVIGVVRTVLRREARMYIFWGVSMVVVFILVWVAFRIILGPCFQPCQTDPPFMIPDESPRL